MQSSIQEASGVPGWAGPGHPSRGCHLQPPGEIVVGAPGAPRSGRREAADPSSFFPATSESRAPEQLEFGSGYHLAIPTTAGAWRTQAAPPGPWAEGLATSPRLSANPARASSQQVRVLEARCRILGPPPREPRFC